MATAVGGIPEQVKGFQPFGYSEINNFDLKQATGILTPPGDANAFALATEFLVKNESLRMQLGENASIDAAERFDVNLQTKNYLEWYQEVIANHALTKN